jgi:hypothetical protein
MNVQSKGQESMTKTAVKIGAGGAFVNKLSTEWSLSLLELSGLAMMRLRVLKSSLGINVNANQFSISKTSPIITLHFIVIIVSLLLSRNKYTEITL